MKFVYIIKILVMFLLIGSYKSDAQKLVGTSDIFTVDIRTGNIYGLVLDSITSQPIAGSVINLSGGIIADSLSSDNGEFTVTNIPLRNGYKLFAFARGYSKKIISDINISAANPDHYIYIYLSISNFNPVIENLIPNPNPAVSEVQTGGNLHRYYLLKDSLTGEPVPLTSITIEDENSSQQTFQSDTRGIVDIEINSADIGSGNVGDTEIFNIVEIDGNPISSPIGFECQVNYSEYSKYWNNIEFAKLGVSFFSVEFEKGSHVQLTERDQSNSDADDILITRQGRGGAGVDFKVGASAGIICGPVSAGAEASAGVGGSLSLVTEDYYQFPHQNYNSTQALIQYILLGDGIFNVLDNVLIRLLTKAEIFFGQQSTIDAAYLGDKKGLDVMVNTSGSANIGAHAGDTVGNNVGIGADASIGNEGHAFFNVIHHDLLQENEYNFGVSGKLTASASAHAGLSFNLPLYEDDDNQVNWQDGLQQKFSIFDFSGTRGFEFSIFKDESTQEFTKYQIKFLHRNDINGWENLLTYEISGNDVYTATQSFREQFSQITKLNNSSSSPEEISISNDLFSQLTYILFSTLYDLQVNEQGDATISYQKDIREITSTGGFEINVKGTLGVILLNAMIGGGTRFEEGKLMISERGKWARGHHLMLEDYGTTIPNIDKEYEQVVQEVIDEIPTSIIEGIGKINIFRKDETSNFGREDETIFYITDSTNTDTTAWVRFPTGSIPSAIDSLYCVSWGWYGSSTRSKASHIISHKVRKIYKLNRERAENSFGMKYGVGGFYQLEPLDTLLADTAFMTITYTDSMVMGFDESLLGMYKEDKANHSWIYVGGVVDTVLNKVEAPISDLSLYTLAPTLPIGRFSLMPVSDSLYADSISTTTVNSGPIFYNNTDTIADGELFTVNTEAGLIQAVDADTSIDGIQVETINGAISFNIRSSFVSARPVISAYSVNGSAKGDTLMVFYDTIPPSAPSGLSGGTFNERIKLSWNQNQERDIAGYKIYYDTDTAGSPYNGTATVYGFPSPVKIGVDTSFTLTGLSNDSLYFIGLTAYDNSGNESSYTVLDSISPVKEYAISAKVFLEGAFDGSVMTTVLNQADSIIPLTQPFSSSPWNYNGGEQVNSIPNDSVVDWILVEIRETTGDSSSATSEKRIYRKAGFLLSDGSISDTSASAKLKIKAYKRDDLYLIIYHRNHLGIMSSYPLDLVEGEYYYNFTSDPDSTYGSVNGIKQIAPGIYGMVAGDGDKNGQIQNQDKKTWNGEFGQSGYIQADYDLNGQVQNQDKINLWLPNFGAGSQIRAEAIGYKSQIPK